MQITEPTTLLTDYTLALLAAYLGHKLWKTGQREAQKSIRFWGLAFFMTALAAFVGGTSHGFALYLNELTKVAIWKITVYSVGFAGFFMFAGTTFASVTNPLSRWLLLIITTKLAVYAVWMAFHDAFIYVIIDYVPAMLGVILLQMYVYIRRREKTATWLIAGVLISFAAAGVQVSGLAIHEHFNHNDLYHVIQMGAMCLLYKGATLLQDRVSAGYSESA